MYELVVAGPGLSKNTNLMVIGYVSDCRELVPLEYQTYTPEFAFIEADVAEVGRALTELNEEIKQFDIRLNDNMYYLFLEQPELHAAVKNAEQELMLLTNPDQVEKDEQAKLDPVKAEIDRLNEEARLAAQREAELKAQDPKRTLNCTKVFRKLSRLCHHDRTKDTDLRALFRVSKHLYAQVDLEALQNLLISVQQYLASKKEPEWFRKNAARRKANILRETEQLLKLREAKAKSPAGRMLELVEAGERREAKFLATQQLNARLADLNPQIRQAAESEFDRTIFSAFSSFAYRRE